nr:hypothetical protein [Tanacetum cinerariifolium]
MVRSMMSLATLPFSFWDYALESAARILNMVPTKKVDKTPYELWHGKVHNLSYLNVWGCEAHVKRHTPDKLQQRSVKCIFVGYPKETMGYYFYYPSENKIVVERYADFLENDFILQKESGRIVELEDEDILPSENTSEHPIEEESLAPIVSQEEDVIPVCRSVRTYKAPDRLCLNVEIDPDRLCFNVEVEEHSLGDLNGPTSYKTALSDPEFEKWLVAMNAKMQSMYDNKVWRLVVLPPNAKVVKSFIDPNHPRKVCKLQRCIYGLKQASKSWNKRFDEEIKKFGFHQNLDEPCVYQKASWSNVIFLILNVDDIILMGNHIPSLQDVKTYLGKCFSMKDLGEAAFILRIKIYGDRSRRLIGLSQNAYLDKILKRYRMDTSKRGSIPMQVDLYLSKSQCATTSAEMKRMQNVPYALAVGSIMYVVRCTRPDVAFAQNITSRFQQSSREAHWTAVKNILKYLRNTKYTLLVMVVILKQGYELTVIAMLDSKSIEMTRNLKLEAEYIVASEAAKEAVWIRKFIDELGVKGARHFKRKYHYVRECIETGEIDIVKVHTDDNLADPFTKALAGPKLTRYARSMGLRPAGSFM